MGKGSSAVCVACVLKGGSYLLPIVLWHHGAVFLLSSRPGIGGAGEGYNVMSADCSIGNPVCFLACRSGSLCRSISSGKLRRMNPPSEL